VGVFLRTPCATHTGIRTSGRSTRPPGRASQLPERSPTARQVSRSKFHVSSSRPEQEREPQNMELGTPIRPVASVLGLSPGGLSAPDHVRPVSYYALFK